MTERLYLGIDWERQRAPPVSSTGRATESRSPPIRSRFFVTRITSSRRLKTSSRQIV